MSQLDDYEISTLAYVGSNPILGAIINIIMAIYEYKCKECGLEIEKFQKMTDEPLIDCPQCCKPTLEKQISNSNFKLKGPGWFKSGGY